MIEVDLISELDRQVPERHRRVLEWHQQAPEPRCLVAMIQVQIRYQLKEFSRTGFHRGQRGIILLLIGITPLLLLISPDGES